MPSSVLWSHCCATAKQGLSLCRRLVLHNIYRDTYCLQFEEPRNNCVRLTSVCKEALASQEAIHISGLLSSHGPPSCDPHQLLLLELPTLCACHGATCTLAVSRIC